MNHGAKLVTVSLSIDHEKIELVLSLEILSEIRKNDKRAKINVVTNGSGKT